jgi:CheY-like chemotaxis protein
MFWSRRSPEISWPKYTHDEIVQRSCILVIDDSEFPLMAAFQADGYHITKWNDVEDVSKLETGAYDLILLDLEGVGQAYSNEQGFGILKHIRETNPAQIVIAYSSHEWSLDYQPFFEAADAAISTTKTDYFELKREVDRFLERRFSVDYYIERAMLALADYRPSTPKADEKIRQAILSGDGRRLAGYLQPRVDDGKIIEYVMQITQIAVQVAQLVQWIH